MKNPFVVGLLLLVSLAGCTNRWTVTTENPRTRFFLDTRSATSVSPGVWDVTERFLDVSTDRWSMETVVRYDCEARTFMTRSVRGFNEHRPYPRASEMTGNTPATVVPGSDEEARLDAVCELVGG